MNAPVRNNSQIGIYNFADRGSQLAHRVNRMLRIKMSIQDIAQYEGVKESIILHQIERWTLPREK